MISSSEGLPAETFSYSRPLATLLSSPHPLIRAGTRIRRLTVVTIPGMTMTMTIMILTIDDNDIDY